MTPKNKRQNKPTTKRRVGRRRDNAHDIAFYRSPDGALPAEMYLDSVPEKIRARIRAVAMEVAKAPPSKFTGGGKWKAMHGSMAGWFEIRVDGTPRRTHYRVFCLLDYEAEGRDRPLLVLIDGRTKPFRTMLSDADYRAVRALGEAYRKTQPRPIG
ncbi:hypothetical protein MRI28_16325 [Nocardiopsis dassonvillei]|uniref:hypothetical protein n=1 Tax=Nocardiopsis dassonvillei TaxID=2014 RepID=UPI00200E5F52|nr:hypothetical protein [Nocardiopsis dassonvillei]MCK9871185.1 hypothetical protein [Nocardiopsis dassonvillei]